LVIHGDADGADWIADAVAQTWGVPRVKFPANWTGEGKSAGPKRNRRMFDLITPDAVLAFPMPDSVGTRDMMRYAKAKGCPVLVCGKDF
jgi:hypothetical protein